MSAYYHRLIMLRKDNAWIRNGDVAGEVLDGNAIAFTYSEDGALRGFAAANPGDAEITVTLPEGEWLGMLNCEGTFSGTVTVPAKTLVLLGAMY